MVDPLVLAIPCEMKGSIQEQSLVDVVLVHVAKKGYFNTLVNHISLEDLYTTIVYIAAMHVYM